MGRDWLLTADSVVWQHENCMLILKRWEEWCRMFNVLLSEWLQENWISVDIQQIGTSVQQLLMENLRMQRWCPGTSQMTNCGGEGTPVPVLCKRNWGEQKSTATQSMHWKSPGSPHTKKVQMSKPKVKTVLILLWMQRDNAWKIGHTLNQKSYFQD